MRPRPKRASEPTDERTDIYSLGAIAPVDFIPIAEEIGLVDLLGEFVMREACSEAASWSRKLKVAVNLSVVQFRSGNLVAMISKVLEETGLPSDRLEVGTALGAFFGFSLQHVGANLRTLRPSPCMHLAKGARFVGSVSVLV